MFPSDVYEILKQSSIAARSYKVLTSSFMYLGVLSVLMQATLAATDLSRADKSFEIPNHGAKASA